MGDRYVESSLVNRGCWNRLKQVMSRAEGGEEVTVGYLGGSITMGSVATRQELCYAYLSHLWWKETFPQAKVNFVNAGIGATTSQFGVARAAQDLLPARPDVVFVEFSVNDDNTGHFQETYEGLIRRLWKSETAPALVLLHNAFYDDGRSAEEIHSALGRYYDLPCVSFKNSVYAKVAAGEVYGPDITPDNLHPNDRGHEMLADTVKWFLGQVWADASRQEPQTPFPEKPLTKNRYEGSVRLRNEELAPVRIEGFTPDRTVQNHITEIFRHGWTASQKGACIECDVNAACLAVQFRRSMHKPAPSATVTVDGEKAAVLNGEFDETWGDLLELQTVYESEAPGPHHVRIELTETHPDDAVPFYLVSLITA